MGGRSLTRGIASAVTILAFNASMADAAATAVANACFVEDNSVMQLPAEKIDPNTDLTGTAATGGVGSLSSEKISIALDTARWKAEYLSRKGVFWGAFIAFENVSTISNGLRPYISPVN